MAKRTHSSVDTLPANLRKALIRMLVDDEYPDDFEGKRKGKPKYKDLVSYCAQHNRKISKSAIGRFGKQMNVYRKMKHSGVITRQVMEGLADEKASVTQKAAAEIITAIIIEFTSSHEKFTTKQIAEIAKAMKDCTSVVIKSDEYTRTRLTKKVEAAARSTKEKLTKAGVDRKLIQTIIDEHLGVVK